MYKPLVLALLIVACTKPNPNRCCTDEADCAAAGIPAGSTCESGLVCRGNQCISEPCTSASDCEASAPYCVAELCAEACSDDMQCPGFGQTADERFCVDGSCHACRLGMTADCPDDAPVCDQGACRECREHAECNSGVCAEDGRCADEGSIAYVDLSGSASSECTHASPCDAVLRALTLQRPYIVIGAGTFTSATALALSGQQHLIGSGTSTVLTRSTAGPILTLVSGNVTLENLQVSGATSNSTEPGTGIDCNANGGAPVLSLERVTSINNTAHGLTTTDCAVTIRSSTFSNNGGTGIWIINGTGNIDACLVSENAIGMNLDSGLYQVTNSIIARNNAADASWGINLYSTEAGNRIEFNTIADNGNSAAIGSGINCNLESQSASFPNNIIVRNRVQTAGSSCTYPGSIVIDTDITPLKFRSPDMAPYDYHVTAGSIAIDMATQSTLDHDVDGDPRATPRDVGADEYVP